MREGNRKPYRGKGKKRKKRREKPGKEETEEVSERSKIRQFITTKGLNKLMNTLNK